ncbi:aminoglycoside phosphotransferase family protein [Actinoalloteichus hymeniacidonis]|uniref:Aminoglycoside phosphotransferase n=1 Tax=Actinoalloteichus hymeniacidonis TaxID=340345 RepID=A0AAC9HK87_9PSEU|nr:aminoglycoside phosphotransferase family protein [Actinoalloteichus hymeniacidonis]AOS60893.1 putative aminoglycoside phosphotransferase [Actinoalloteichus hymeniacidonis]MBB5911107.1 aminoglycoside phosphotransferase (APT) family kinase protein [Actinoalloteichus hymeniacidonis]
MTVIAENRIDGRFTIAKLTVALEEICARVGLDPRGARLIRVTNNAVFELADRRHVVRIVASARLRHRAEKVVRIARWLAENDVSAVRLPAGIEQPVYAAGQVATIWEMIPHVGPPPGAKDLARLLRDIHRLQAPDFPLPTWRPLDDVHRRLADAEELSDRDRAFLEGRCAEVADRLRDLRFPLPQGVLHGDAHLGNLIPGPDGTAICDFDSTCVGPREWDLTPLAVGAQRFLHPEEQQRLLAYEYGFDITRWSGFAVLRDVRELKLTTSVLPILRSNPGVRAQLQLRLESLRSGDVTVPWTPYR